MSGRRWSAAILVAAMAMGSVAEAGGARTHTVYPGQTLGKIAKRYNVSVEALCEANGIRRNAPIKPGQELIIPGKEGADGKDGRDGKSARDDKDGRDGKESSPKGDSAEEHDAAPKAAKTERRSRRSSSGAPKVHTVYSGQTLGMIATRYRVTVDALCHANDISRRQSIRPNQRLIVPAEGDEDGKDARRLRLAGFLDDESVADKDRGKDKDRDWTEYRRTAKKRGYVTMKSLNESWRGYVLGPGNRLLPKAQQKVSDTLASWRTGKRVEIDERLIVLIAQVSDTFGGRPIHVVSGYREHSHSATSRHPKGRALDFSVEGVPNWAVRDYLRTIDGIGVGYYPNSSFVHMDVREDAQYWVDHSGPGEPPRYAHSDGDSGE